MLIRLSFVPTALSKAVEKVRGIDAASGKMADNLDKVAGVLRGDELPF